MTEQERAYWNSVCEEYEENQNGARYLNEDKLEHDIERLCA